MLPCRDGGPPGSPWPLDMLDGMEDNYGMALFEALQPLPSPRTRLMGIRAQNLHKTRMIGCDIEYYSSLLRLER